MSEKLVSTFPNATYILFTSFPPKPEALLFGKVVGVYDLQQAIQDDVAIPYKIEQHELKKITLPSFQQKDLPSIEVDGLYQETIPHQILEYMAQKIIKSFESRQEKWKGKGIVVTGDISTATRLSEHILQVKPHWQGNSDSSGYVKAISSVDNTIRKNTLLKRFQAPDDSLSILIGTGSFLVGHDNPLIHTIYVISPISRQLQYQLVSVVSRRSQDKEDGLIVDFIGSNWELE